MSVRRALDSIAQLNFMKIPSQVNTTEAQGYIGMAGPTFFWHGEALTWGRVEDFVTLVGGQGTATKQLLVQKVRA